MIRCPNCGNQRPTFVRSRLSKQWIWIPLLRCRWCCMSCGNRFTAFLWAKPTQYEER